MKLLSYIPVSTNPCGSYEYGQLANNPDWQVIGRVDYIRSEKHTLYGRWYIYNYTGETFFDGKNALTTGPNPGLKQMSQIATFGDTYLFSPTEVNSFHATYNRRSDKRGAPPNLFGPQSLGIKNTEGGPFADNMPDNYIQVTVGNYFNVACGTCAPGYFTDDNYQISDDFSMIKGKHQIGFGIDGRKDQFNETANQQSNGQWTFSGGTTSGYSGDNLADLLLGHLSGWNQGNALSDYMRQTVFAAYIQDTWRVTDHLTVNLGARWEPDQPVRDKYCRGNQFNLADFIAGVHSTEYPAPRPDCCSAMTPATPTAVRSRSPTGSTRRLASDLYGIPRAKESKPSAPHSALLHDTAEIFYPERWTTNPPYASQITLTDPPITAPFSNPWNGYVSPTGVAGDPFPGAAIFPSLGAYVSVPPNLHATYMMQWNLSYSRQIAKDWLATATYIGNRTNHIYGANDINMPTPAANATNERASPPAAEPDQCDPRQLLQHDCSVGRRGHLSLQRPAAQVGAPLRRPLHLAGELHLVAMHQHLGLRRRTGRRRLSESAQPRRRKGRLQLRPPADLQQFAGRRKPRHRRRRPQCDHQGLAARAHRQPLHRPTLHRHHRVGCFPHR
jgi:hypothetical protein